MYKEDIEKIKGKSVLITGGAGFIGSNLAKKLEELGAKVSIFVLPEENLTKIKDIEDKIKIVRGSLLNELDVVNAVKDKDYLFHFAWQTDLKKSMSNPKQDISNDIIGLINILESCKDYNKDIKIVFASTVTISGENSKVNSDENVKDEPISVYEVNKLFGEKYLHMYYKNYGINYSVLRLSNVFGEGQSIDNPSRGVLNFMIGRALRGEDLTVYGDGKFIRDYCYIGNYLSAFILAAISDKTNGQIHVLGSGIGRDFNDVVGKIKSITENLTNREVNIKHIPIPEGEHKINERNFSADFSKFSKATGWRPEIDFETGLKKTIEYYWKKEFENGR
ncbi:MAG: GDP-mannose 4,6-dehydratase [Candidatus Pacearchaeota archaeon]